MTTDWTYREIKGRAEHVVSGDENRRIKVILGYIMRSSLGYMRQ